VHCRDAGVGAQGPTLDQNLRQRRRSIVVCTRHALRPDSPLLFVSAGGFTERFRQVANDVGHTLLMWTVEGLF
jgi:hypothetical protein